MSEAIWSLVGVFVGFLLSEGTQWIKRHTERRELHASLFAELQSIIRMTPSKLEILAQAEQSLRAGLIMPSVSTHFPAHAYSRVMSVAPDVLASEASDCLHVLYERLRIIDESMDAMESRFNEITKTHSVGQAVDAAIGSIQDLEKAIGTCQILAQSILDGTPINVYQLQGGTQQALQGQIIPPLAGTQP